jgi:spermidine synthase
MRIAILSGILFLSGLSALLFETLWLRLSGLAFGNSVWSAALILSSFMAGLALGTAIAASSQICRARPLYVYALLELAVALFGCTIVFGLPLLGEILRPVFQVLWNHETVLHSLRFSLSFLILLVPTTAMGLTLPVLLEYGSLQRHPFGHAIGLLYGCNTLGATAGSLLGEAYLVGAFGLARTALVAGSMNCLAAGIAWLLTTVDSPATASTSERAIRVHFKLQYRPPWRLLFTSLGAGAILLCLEVVWFRFLRLYVASSSTAFSVMLAVVLAGIGLGGIAASAIHRRARSDWLLPVLLLFAAIAALLPYLFFPMPGLGGKWQDFYLDSWIEIGLLSLVLMFPVAFLSGILFPTIVARVQSRVENRMNSVGITTLFNTTGAAAGPLLASFLLLPNIGFEWTLVSCAVGYVLLATLVFKEPSWSYKPPFKLVIFAANAALIVIIITVLYRRNETHFAHARRPFEADGSRLVKKIEGTSDTLQLLRREFLGEPYYYRLVTNAFSMSSTEYPNQRYMKLFAYLPLTLRPESEDALLICYGCGVTAQALLHSPLKHVDVVDISKEVFDLADFYSGANYSNPLHDPRVTTFVQDGRFFLQASPRRYDVITGEPPPPKVAGTVNLYTEEFFSLMKKRLKDGGIATFWLPIYQLRVPESKAILRAFHNAFPNASIWASSDEEWIMMGINGPGRKLSEEDIRRLWTNAVTGTDLTRIGIEVPEQMAALFLMDSAELDRVTDGIEPLTDFYPKRLTDAPADLQDTHRFARTYMETRPAVRRFFTSPLIERVWPETLKTTLEPFFMIRETRYLAALGASNKLAELDLYLRGSRLRTPVLEALNSNEFRLSIAEKVASGSQPLPLEALPDLVAGALARRDLGGAIQLLEKEGAHGFASRSEFFLLTYLYCLSGEVGKAETLAAANIGSIQKDSFVNWLWGNLQAEFGFRPPH